MKKNLQNCSKCGKETWHSVGKKQATSKSRAYTKRTTSKCNKCGEREVSNKKLGRRTIISGQNQKSKSKEK